ncbi:peroxisome assembly protein 12-A [Toxorhynchites rutilus septentrionalis]|uniref:peroxisome assembly protein 12-A n=1 Tax=Toxorhynchites rutilus septentrionalis TaxID=329112 RepID=UPI002479BA6A|nr:peroxisome assembly protein 12-A [Toxorhynchites rutilus septentrionalis]
MAAKGAHITSNIEARPSIFEVVAADYLNATFYPALQKVANFLDTIKPNFFECLSSNYDEIYLLFNYIVQSYYVRNKGGSLSEVFYGLTRVSPKTNKLTRNQERWTIGSLVLTPYAYQKIDKKIHKWKEDYEQGRTISKYKQQIVRIVPYLKACLESMKLLQYIAYLTGFSSTHSPILRILNLSLTYSTEEKSLTFKDILSGQITPASVLSTALLRSLELSAFFLQFIEWWHNEANMGDLSKLPVPDRPSIDATNDKYNGKCPLCLQRWQIPTAVSVSGYVYCYRCIVAYLQNKSQCPVTKYPTTINDLVRIFDETD